MIFNDKKIKRRLKELEDQKLLVGEEFVDLESVLTMLVDYLGLKPCWKIEKGTGHKIVWFKKKRKR
ncbi:MAG: hypothetical protein AABY15_05130 [Nanoarchaeota archaeon]